MIRRPPRSTLSSSSAASDVYKRQTDGNVHIQYVRKDIIEDPDNKKRFADKFGKELKFPQTWEEEQVIQEFFMDPSKDLYGSANLRNRANGPTLSLIHISE